MATFQEDVDFCAQHTGLVVLQDGDRRLAVAPLLQARLWTSTLGGPGGKSLGWVNRELLSQGALKRDFNPYGGEDRIWIGPEAGQFGYHFGPGDPFDLAHARVPAVVDREAFETISKEPTRALFRKNISMPNHSNVLLEASLDREITLFGEGETFDLLEADPKGLRAVGFQSRNTLTHLGKSPWSKATGVPVPWVIGMFPATPGTVVTVPIREGSQKERGTAAVCYFGALGGDRLKVSPRAVFFKGDGSYRSKIGVGPRRALGLLGSWDPEADILTIARCGAPPPDAVYANFLWEVQKDPFSGDGIQTYNDGPPEPGAPSYGPFYELETVAPVVEAVPGGSVTHIHQTFHLSGERGALDAVARRHLNAGLDEIEQTF